MYKKIIPEYLSIPLLITFKIFSLIVKNVSNKTYKF